MISTRNIFIIAKPQNAGARAILEVVRDWTLLGFLGQSIWFDPESPGEVVRVTSGGAENLDTLDWVGSVEDFSSIEFFVLQPQKDPNSLVSWKEIKDTLSPFGRVTLTLPKAVNVVIATSEGSDEGVIPAIVNFLAVPQDGFSPNGGSVPVTKSSKNYSIHGAKELATVAGLWSGQAESGLKGEQVLPGRTDVLSIGRSFVRYVDASSLVETVVQSVLDVDFSKLPQPVDQQADSLLESIPQGNASESVVAVADSFSVAHPELLYKAPPRPSEQIERADFNLIALVKGYFRYVKDWIVRQPGDLLAQSINRFKMSLATKAEKYFGGEEPAMRVYLAGVPSQSRDNGSTDATESILSWAESQASKETTELRAVAPASPGTLWKDMFEVATSLADGGPISNQDVEMPSFQGGTRRVVTNPELIAPDYKGRRFDLPAYLDLGAAGRQLKTDDPLTALLIQEQLERVLKSGESLSPSDYVVLSKKLTELTEWIKTNRSFTWNIGNKLAQAIIAALGDWQRLMDEVRAAAKIDTAALVAAEEKAQKALKRLLKGGLWIVLGAMAAWLVQAVLLFFSFGAWPVLSSAWGIPVAIVSGLFLLWNVISASSLSKALREKHNLEIAIKQAEKKLEEMEKYGPSLAREVYRLTSLYQQYRSWGGVLGALIHRTSSAGRESRNDADRGLPGNSLLASMAVAKLNPEGKSSENLLSDVRKRFYSTGWIYGLFSELVDSEGIAQFELWADGNTLSQSPLTRLTKVVSDPNVEEKLTDVSRKRITNLAVLGTAYQKWAISRNDAVGDLRTTTGEQFIGELGRGAERIPAQDLVNGESKIDNTLSVDNQNSSFWYDARLELSSDLPQTYRLQANAIPSRALDFMGVRLEMTSRLTPQKLNGFTAPVETVNDLISLDEPAGPEA